MRTIIFCLLFSLTASASGKPAVCYVGTSLTFGYAQNASPYPVRAASASGRAASNMGVGGDRLSSISSRFTQFCAPFPYGVGVVEGGTNDLSLDSTAGTVVAAAFLALADAMHAAGIPHVVGVTVPPLTGASSWGSIKETQRGIANAAIIAGASSRPWLSIVNSDDVVGDGATPPAIQVALDYGDHRHLSSAGLQALAEAVVAKF